MSSQRYSETRTSREESRRGNDNYDVPFTQRVDLPIQHSTSSFSDNINEQRVQERIRQQNTTVQWVNDPVSGSEKFRVTINIDGFHQNEVNIRVEGNKLIVNGEHFENQNQGTAKKLIEKSYELPNDVESQSPQVTFPTPATMQVDFPSRFSNVIIDDGRTSSKNISKYNVTHRIPPRFTEEKSSTEFTSTKKLGSGGGSSTGFERSSSPRTYSNYDELCGGDNAGRSKTYSSASNYQSNDYQSPSRGGFIDSTTDSFKKSSSSDNPTYKINVTAGDPQTKTTYSSPSRSESGGVYEKKFSETHSEHVHRRSSPTSGMQTSREVEHHRSGSPSIVSGIDENRFRTSVNLDRHSMTPPASSRNVEVREYSRRVGSNGNNNNNNNNFDNNEPSLFSRGFNSDAFYRSAFQPEIFTDDHGEKRIEMKLDVNNYEPNEIKISIKDNDLIVQAEHNVERLPTSSSRAYFFKQITLPPNTDFTSLASQYRPDGKLHITAKIPHEHASIKHN